MDLMKNKLYTPAPYVLLGIFLIFSGFFTRQSQGADEAMHANTFQTGFQFNFSQGEEITYSVKKWGIQVGESKLIYEGERRLDNQQVILIVFRTNIVKFDGEERIYLDKEKLLPILVERDIKLFGKTEVITERYDQSKGVVEITKQVKGKVTTQTIKKDDVIDNVQAFIFRYRKRGNYQIGQKFDMQLPLAEVKLQIETKEMLKLLDVDYDAYFMEGDPRNLKIWFDANDHHVPLRIDGNFGAGKISLILNEYKNRSALTKF